jgi:hypothetical protein
MDFASFLLFAVMPKGQLPEPSLWMHPSGKIFVEGRAFEPRFVSGVRRIATHLGTTYDFAGKRSGVQFGDLPQLRITESITVSLWINPRSYVNEGPGAQILFRGDDRIGVDPYFLAIHGDGTLNFAVQQEDQKIRHVAADLAKNRWSQIVAHWEAETGYLKMWLDGELVGLAKTTVRPFSSLDGRYAPGFSIGNVQNENGPHNQPFNGMIADLRIYRGAWSPDDLDLRRPFGEPPPAKLTKVPTVQ